MNTRMFHVEQEVEPARYTDRWLADDRRAVVVGIVPHAGAPEGGVEVQFIKSGETVTMHPADLRELGSQCELERKHGSESSMRNSTTETHHRQGGMGVPEYAKSRDVETFAAGLKQQALQCRTYGHSFNPYTVATGRAEGNPSVYYEQTLRCKCRVKRRLLLTRTGAVVSSVYDYTDAPGYLTDGIGRIVGEGRDVLRLEAITRLIEKEGD